MGARDRRRHHNWTRSGRRFGLSAMSHRPAADSTGADLGWGEPRTAPICRMQTWSMRAWPATESHGGRSRRGTSWHGPICMRARLDAGTRIDEKWRVVNELVSTTQDSRNLAGADLSRSYLDGVYLRRAELQGDGSSSEAIISNADLRYADLQDANLAGADLTQVCAPGSKPGRRRPARRPDESLADLRLAKLEGAQVDDDYHAAGVRAPGLGTGKLVGGASAT